MHDHVTMPHQPAFDPEPVEVTEPIGSVEVPAGPTWWPGVLVAVLTAILMATAAMKHGPGLSPDSFMYLGGAEGIVAGRGFTSLRSDGSDSPIYSYPPLYSVMLATLEWVGGNPERRAGVWMQAGIFGVNVLLAGWLVWRGAGGPWLRRAGRPTVAAATACALAAAVLAVSGDMLTSHTYLWTEGPYLVVMLAALGLTAAWVERPNWRLAIGIGVCLALAYLLRYAALSLIGYVLVVLLFVGGVRYFRWQHVGDEEVREGPSPLRPTVVSVLLVALLAGGAVVGWSIRNKQIAGGTGIGRKLAWHPPTQAHVDKLLMTLERWVEPAAPAVGNPGEPTSTALLLAAVLAALAVGLNVIPRRSPVLPATTADSSDWIPGGAIWPVMLGYTVTYAVFLGVSISLFDSQTYPDYRIMLPAYAAVIVAAFSGLGRVPVLRGESGSGSGLRAVWGMRLATSVALAGAFALLANTAWGGSAYVRNARDHGLGFNTPQWQTSATLDDVRALPEGTIIFSNGPDVITNLTGRDATLLPKHLDQNDTTRQTPNPSFPKGVEQMVGHIGDGQGVVVEFSRIGRWMVAPPKAIAEEVKLLPLTKHAGDGGIWAIEGTPRDGFWRKWAAERKRVHAKETP